MYLYVYTPTHTQAHASARTHKQTHAHARVRARTHPPTRTHTHTGVPGQMVEPVVFRARVPRRSTPRARLGGLGITTITDTSVAFGCAFGCIRGTPPASQHSHRIHATEVAGTPVSVMNAFTEHRLRRSTRIAPLSACSVPRRPVCVCVCVCVCV